MGVHMGKRVESDGERDRNDWKGEKDGNDRDIEVGMMERWE